jgi:hypothetical protein
MDILELARSGKRKFLTGTRLSPLKRVVVHVHEIYKEELESDPAVAVISYIPPYDEKVKGSSDAVGCRHLGLSSINLKLLRQYATHTDELEGGDMLLVVMDNCWNPKAQEMTLGLRVAGFRLPRPVRPDWVHHPYRKF